MMHGTLNIKKKKNEAKTCSRMSSEFSV